MYLLHEGTPLADSTEVADSILAQAVGLRLRTRFPRGHAVVFPFDRVGLRAVDMLLVRFPIDVLWLVDERVHRKRRLRPWIGVGIARADTVIELPAGVGDAVAEGDELRLVDEPPGE